MNQHPQRLVLHKEIHARPPEAMAPPLVEIEQQQSAQGLLGAMNRRQGLQLQLQATVEGLSVAAITYYVVGLVSYLANGAQALGWPWSPEGSAAFAIPAVALAVWLSLRRLHARLLRDGA